MTKTPKQFHWSILRRLPCHSAPRPPLWQSRVTLTVVTSLAQMLTWGKTRPCMWKGFMNCPALRCAGQLQPRAGNHFGAKHWTGGTEEETPNFSAGRSQDPERQWEGGTSYPFLPIPAYRLLFPHMTWPFLTLSDSAGQRIKENL